MSKMERVDSRSATSAPDDVTMPAIARAAKQPSARAVRDEAPEVPPIAPAARTLGVTSQEEPANKTAPRSPRRHLVRGGLFPLLPPALIAGAYWYVTIALDPNPRFLSRRAYQMYVASRVSRTKMFLVKHISRRSIADFALTHCPRRSRI
jgi:hypothetical protein